MRSQNRFALLALALTLAISPVCLKTAAAQPTPKPRIPTAIEECETRAKTPLCTTWHWNGTEFNATWPDGSIGIISIRLEDSPGMVSGAVQDARVSFKRIDKTGALPGLVAVYSGELHNGKIDSGLLLWTYFGIQKKGGWKATFVYAAAEESLPAKPVALAPSTPPAPVAVPVAEARPAAPQAAPAPPVAAVSKPAQTQAPNSQELSKLNEDLAKLDLESQQLLEQRKELQKQCPTSTSDLGCLERLTQLTAAVARNFQSSAKLMEQKSLILRSTR